VSVGSLAQCLRQAGFEVVASGTSRNWLFAAVYPRFVFSLQPQKIYRARPLAGLVGVSDWPSPL